MNRLSLIIIFALVVGCRQSEPDPVSLILPPVVGVSVAPAILEADVEGVGKALIYGRSIIIKLPDGYTKKTIRVTYKVTEGVKQITPSSGADISFGDGFRPTVCIQQGEHGSCLVSYDLIIEMASSLAIIPDSGSCQLTLANYYQSYKFTYRFDKFTSNPTLSRQFRLRLVNKGTGLIFTSNNYKVTDGMGNPIYVSQPTQTPFPTSGKLEFSGLLPLGLSAGEYTATIQTQLCYGNINGFCSTGFGYESLELPEPLILRAGPPIVGEVSFSPSPTRDLTIRGRNFLTAITLPVVVNNDFLPTLTTQAIVVNDSVAKLRLADTQPIGQYRLDILPAVEKPYRKQLVIPSASAPYWFNYVGIVGSYDKNRNFLPTLPVFKGGESLEVLYGFVTDEPILVQSTRMVKSLRLINVSNANQRYDLIANGIFSPFVLYLEFKLWKWTLPAALPKGEYALVFEDFDGKLSLPYYQKIRVE